MKTYDVVAAAIEAQETGHCFALLGDGNMHFAGALAHLGMPFTYARHEHCAVSMAMAYARVTGRPGLATVTCGPGLTQVMTGLAAAVRARIPLVLFVGESPLRNSWYNQEIDQAPFVTACGAEYVRILHKPRITRQIQDAFARTQMTGIPVVIGMPFDLQESDWGDLAYKVEKAADLIPAAGKMFPDPANVTSIAAMVAAAKAGDHWRARCNRSRCWAVLYAPCRSYWRYIANHPSGAWSVSSIGAFAECGWGVCFGYGTRGLS